MIWMILCSILRGFLVRCSRWCSLKICCIVCLLWFLWVMMSFLFMFRCVVVIYLIVWWWVSLLNFFVFMLLVRCMVRVLFRSWWLLFCEVFLNLVVGRFGLVFGRRICVFWFFMWRRVLKMLVVLIFGLGLIVRLIVFCCVSLI